MKKHTIIVRAENGDLTENFIITKDSARTLKAANIPGLVAITSSARVSHPSPAIMVKALLELGVDVGSFYTTCEVLKGRETETTTETDGETETE